MTAAPSVPQPPGATAVLVLRDGSVFWGRGVGAGGVAEGEVCFNTAITGYQEIMTDPSYAGQIITFTFPHIGNVGANHEDIETATPAARGCVLRTDVTLPSNFRAVKSFSDWMAAHHLMGIAGVDTRRLTRRIRGGGAAPDGVLAHNPDGVFDLPALIGQARTLQGLEGRDLAKDVTCMQSYRWTGTPWQPGKGYGVAGKTPYKVVALDYGIKRNILRNLAGRGCEVIVVPAETGAEDILAQNPDGIFLSNGPGDPAATGLYAIPTIQKLLQSGKPIFGICLGHQMLCLALGARTRKMKVGHRGANHPVKDLTTGVVEITSQNHGFVVDNDSLPEGVEVTHKSLFDGTLAGIRIKDKPVFSVQYHPEASPGPRDSRYLFDRFIDFMKAGSC